LGGLPSVPKFLGTLVFLDRVIFTRKAQAAALRETAAIARNSRATILSPHDPSESF